MDRRAFIGTVAGGLLAAPLAVEAQPAPKTAQIGFLSLSSGPTPTMDISPGLRELGWIEGQNIAVEYRWAAGREDQLPALAAETRSAQGRRHCDLVGAGCPGRQASDPHATFVADPVGAGLVASLARPGGNITGLTTLAAGLSAKRPGLLKAVVSGSTRVAVLWQRGALGGNAPSEIWWRRLKSRAGRSGCNCDS